MMHTDAQQTAALHAIPAFAEAMRARGFRVGDWVEWRTYEALVLSNPSPNCGLRHCPITMDIKPVGIARVEAKPADCRLMASEADLTAFLQTQCHRLIVESYTDEVYVRLENPGGRLASGIAIGYRAVAQGHADTRIGALVAACKAVEEVRE
jgi:hypothetical protein